MLEEVMVFLLAIQLLLLSKPTLISSSSPKPTFPIAIPGCSDSCGNVNVPYPFGIGIDCSYDYYFSVTCDNSSDPPKTLIDDASVTITEISLEGQLNVLPNVTQVCYDASGVTVVNKSVAHLASKFTVNSNLNKFFSVGCGTSATFSGISYNTQTGQDYDFSCDSICSKASEVVNGTCWALGRGCCKSTIPNGVNSFSISTRIDDFDRDVQEFSPCSFAFVAEEEIFNFFFDNLTNLEQVEMLPMVLDWAVGEDIWTCETARKEFPSACQNNTHCMDGKGDYFGYRCFCNEGYRGNPYLPKIGCQDINECEESNDCMFKELCNNFEGGYTCSCPDGYNVNGDGKRSEGCIPQKKNHQKLVIIILAGITAGILVILVICSWGYYLYRNRKMMRLREKFFRENGGLILQKQLKGQEESSNDTRIFTAEELKKATNNFNDDRIVGQGGFGTVYKGYLTDNKEVAIKKSKIIDRNQIEQFINEVVILSQVNHRNVVKLLGCCLETEVPILVYEFINNGTLFKHLHNEKTVGELCWDIRLRIAAETAEALAYLHSAASPPIIHRDVKTMNILLDENYIAKVSDFGASRLGSLDHTQLSTMVQVTYGYLDPEFFQTFQLTEKSDVYSFGIVLVELLTGKMPISFDRSQDETNLGHHFLSSIKENCLLDILDDYIVCEDNIEQLKQVSMLAQRCLIVKGEDRPSMKEVAVELVGLRITSKHAGLQTAQAYEEEIDPLNYHQESNAFHGGNIMLTSTYYTLGSQVVLPSDNGR